MLSTTKISSEQKTINFKILSYFKIIYFEDKSLLFI